MLEGSIPAPVSKIFLMYTQHSVRKTQYENKMRDGTFALKVSTVSESENWNRNVPSLDLILSSCNTVRYMSTDSVEHVPLWVDGGVGKDATDC